MISNNNIDPMLSARDVAHLINVHINTVRRWSNQGALKTYYIGSRGDRRYEKEDIYHFLRQKPRTVEKVGHLESVIQ